ncbi:MAG: peptidoglycan-binding protein [Burkholderiaceae bacterium]|nr:peptidoglycan-binding protein [Burkholderiaceae bacterium]
MRKFFPSQRALAVASVLAIVGCSSAPVERRGVVLATGGATPAPMRTETSAAAREAVRRRAAERMRAINATMRGEKRDPSVPSLAAPTPVPSTTAPIANQSTPVLSGGSGAVGADLPPTAKPGQCYARIYLPPKYRTVTERVVVRDAREVVETTPPRFAPVSEQVLVRPGSARIEVIPAEFKWVEERVLVTPETRRLVEVPAQIEQVSEQVLVKAGYTTWKKGRGPIQRIDKATGEIMCLVEVPPVYKTVTRSVVKRPASVREEVVPAVYRTVRTQTMVKPATTREVPVAAQYRTVTVNRLIEPAGEKRRKLPAEYGSVTREEMITPGAVEWREILCETNMTKARVADIQRALRASGFDPGPIDGVIASRTMAAVNAFQRARNLPVDEYLNIETVRALGVPAR